MKHQSYSIPSVRVSASHPPREDHGVPPGIKEFNTINGRRFPLATLYTFLVEFSTWRCFPRTTKSLSFFSPFPTGRRFPLVHTTYLIYLQIAGPYEILLISTGCDVGENVLETVGKDSSLLRHFRTTCNDDVYHYTTWIPFLFENRYADISHLPWCTISRFRSVRRRRWFRWIRWGRNRPIHETSLRTDQFDGNWKRAGGIFFGKSSGGAILLLDHWRIVAIDRSCNHEPPRIFGEHFS